MVFLESLYSLKISETTFWKNLSSIRIRLIRCILSFRSENSEIYLAEKKCPMFLPNAKFLRNAFEICLRVVEKEISFIKNPQLFKTVDLDLVTQVVQGQDLADNDTLISAIENHELFFFLGSEICQNVLKIFDSLSEKNFYEEFRKFLFEEDETTSVTKLDQILNLALSSYGTLFSYASLLEPEDATSSPFSNLVQDRFKKTLFFLIDLFLLPVKPETIHYL